MVPLTAGRVHQGKFLSIKSITNNDGWIDAIKYIPPDFVLVEVLTSRVETILKAWVNMRKWDGLLIRDSDIIKFWKPIPSQEQARRSRKNMR